MQQAESVLWVAVTTAVDKYGDAGSGTEASPVELQALVAGRSASESADPNAPAVIVGKTLYLLDTDAVPGASDWFTVRGDRYEVEGEAHRWGSMGVEVAVARADTAP